MTMFRHSRRLLLPFMLLMGVAACAKDPFEVRVINCPAAGVVANVGSLTRFVGSGRENDDVTLQASIGGVESACSQDGRVTHTVAFNLIAEKGPAFRGGDVELTYFVALLRDNFQITNKKTYTVTLRFAPGQDVVGTREIITQVFEDIDIARRYDYELLIGFQVSEDELAYNVLR